MFLQVAVFDMLTLCSFYFGSFQLNSDEFLLRHCLVHDSLYFNFI